MTTLLNTPDHSTTIETIDEAIILCMLRQGKTDEATQALFNLVVVNAQNGHFDEAERLRGRMCEMTPVALHEIVRSAKIIDQEKQRSIKEADLKTWRRLAAKLSPEEFSTIYHEFETLEFAPKETIIEQGADNEYLFFISQGVLKVSHTINGEELFIITLGQGQLVGENFFNPSMWTVSLTTLTNTVVYRLKKTKLEKWQDEYPGIYSKLETYYNRNNPVRQILQEKVVERRISERFLLTRKIAVQPLDRFARRAEGRNVQAELVDISTEGISFLMRIAQKEHIKSYLGKKLMVTLPGAEDNGPMAVVGTSTGIRQHNLLEREYCIHMRFDQQLDCFFLQNIFKQPRIDF